MVDKLFMRRVPVRKTPRGGHATFMSRLLYYGICWQKSMYRGVSSSTTGKGSVNMWSAMCWMIRTVSWRIRLFSKTSKVALHRPRRCLYLKNHRHGKFWLCIWKQCIPSSRSGSSAQPKLTRQVEFLSQGNSGRSVLIDSAIHTNSCRAAFFSTSRA